MRKFKSVAIVYGVMNNLQSYIEILLDYQIFTVSFI